jgi:hypothetical protein
MKDQSFGISLIGFLLIVDGLCWWLFMLVPFSSYLNFQVMLFGREFYGWLFSENSVDVIYLLFFKNRVVLLFGGLALIVTGGGVIMLKPWARWLLMGEALGFSVLALVLLAQGAMAGIGMIIVWGLIFLYATRPRMRELFRQGWQDYPPVDARQP